jgi:hypothetical protein
VHPSLFGLWELMISMSLTMTGTTIGSIWLPTHIEILPHGVVQGVPPQHWSSLSVMPDVGPCLHEATTSSDDA